MSRFHPQDDDDLADMLPGLFSLPHIKLHASKADMMGVAARCPRKSSPHVDGWRFEILHALGSPYTLTGLAEGIVNREVPQSVASLLASATLIPQDKLYPKQRRAQEQGLRDQNGTVRPIGVGSVLVRFANPALLTVIGDEESQSLAARHQFGVGVRGLEIVQFMVRTAIDASLDLADVQVNASNAYNEILRRPLFEELSLNPALRPLLRIATMLHGRPSTLYVYDSSNAHVQATQIPSTRGVH
jgi:hypothetical protein